MVMGTHLKNMNRKNKDKKVTTINDLAVLINTNFKKSQNHTNKKNDELVGIMFKAFDSNQKYMDKRFDIVTEEMREGFKKTSENFKEVSKKIDNISSNIVDVVRKEEFDKLEIRVNSIETTKK